MSGNTTKRVAQIFLDAKATEQVLERLRVEAARWVAELEKAPKGSKAALEATKNLNQISAQYNRLEKSIKGSTAEVAKSEGVFASLQKTLGPMSHLIAGAFTAHALINFGERSIEAAEENEKAQARIRTALQNTGEKVGLTMEQLTAQASALQNASIFSDEDILNQATTRFVSFGNIAGDNLLRAQQAAVDLSTTMQGDLSAASLAVGKALNSPLDGLTALQKQGIRFTEDQKAVIKSLMDTGDVAGAQGVILAELEKRYAGQAAAQAEAEGGTRQLHVATDEFMEGLGGKLLPVLKEVEGAMADVVNTVGEWFGLTTKQSESTMEQQVELNSLFDTLRNVKLSEEERNGIVERINKEYADYIPRLVSVTDGERELAQVQAAANRFLAERIDLLAKQEVLEEARKNAVEQRKDQVKAEMDLQRALRGNATAWENARARLLGFGDAATFAMAQVAAQKRQAEEATKEYADQERTIGSLSEAERKLGEQRKRLQTVGDVQRASREELTAAIEQGIARQNELFGVNDKEAQRIGEQVGRWQQEVESRDAISAAQVRQASTLGEIDDAIKKLREQLDGVSNAEQYKALMDQIAVLEKRRDDITKGATDIKQRQQDIQRLKDTVAKASDEMARARLTGLEREVAAERAKYADMRKDAHGNAELIAQITELEGRAVLAIRAKYAEQEAVAAQKLADEIRAIRAEQIARDQGGEQVALEAIRREYRQRMQAVREGISAVSAIEAERDAAIAQVLAQREARQRIADERELTAIRSNYAERFAAARGNAQQTLALENELAQAIEAARERQRTTQAAPASGNDPELAAINAAAEQRIAAARRTNLTIGQLTDEMEAELTRKQVEQFAARKAANERELEDIRANYAERLAAARQLAQDLAAAAGQGGAGADANDPRVAAAQQAARELEGIEAELNNALALKRQEQVQGTVESQARITDATVQAYADRLGAVAAADRQEVDATIEKYDQLFTAAGDDAARRAELEVLLGNELRDIRTQQLADRQEQLDAFEERVQSTRVSQAEAQLAFMDEQHQAELDKAEEQNQNTEEMLARHAQDRADIEAQLQQAKVDTVNEAYAELYALADKQGIDTTELQRLHGEAIHIIEQEQAAASVATTEEKNKRILESEKKRNAALKQVGMEMLDAFDALFQATAGSAEEAESYHKILTAFKLSIDTASAIGSIVAAASIGDPFTAAIRIASGIAIVLTNIAKATQLLKSDTPKAPSFSGTAKAEGGYTGTSSTATRGGQKVPAAQDIAWFDEARGTTVTLSQPPQYKSDIADGGHIRSASYGLIGERGPEWVAPNWQLNHPTLQPMFRYLEDVRQSGQVYQPAFAAGGSTTRGTALVNAAAPTTGGAPAAAAPAEVRIPTDPALLALIQQSNAINAELSRQLSAGIGVSLDKLEDAQARMSTIRNSTSYNA